VSCVGSPESAAADGADMLRRELAEEERPNPRSSPAARAPPAASSPESDSSDDEDEGGGAEAEISLGEVRASEVGVRARPPRLERLRWNEEQRAAEMAAQAFAQERGGSAALALSVSEASRAPPPPLPDGQVSPADCYILVGGVPATMPNPELRGLAEKFGPIRSMRVLEEPGRSQRSAGIALFEYASPEGVRRAAAPGAGLATLSAFLVVGALPRVVLVGRELLNMMRAGDPPWPEGGPASDDLRCVLNRQFEMWNLTLRESRGRSFDDSSPLRGSSNGGSLRRRGSGPSDDPEPRAAGEGWEGKLKALRKRVNSKTDLGADEKVQRIR